MLRYFNHDYTTGNYATKINWRFQVLTIRYLGPRVGPNLISLIKKRIMVDQRSLPHSTNFSVPYGMMPSTSSSVVRK